MSCTTDITWTVGQQAKLTAEFRDLAQSLADPTTITFRMLEPSGTITTYIHGTDAQLVRASTGSYYVLWMWADDGTHLHSFEGTGTIVAYEEGSVVVEARSF